MAWLIVFITSASPSIFGCQQQPVEPLKDVENPTISLYHFLSHHRLFSFGGLYNPPHLLKTHRSRPDLIQAPLRCQKGSFPTRASTSMAIIRFITRNCNPNLVHFPPSTETLINLHYHPRHLPNIMKMFVVHTCNGIPKIWTQINQR